MDCGSFCPEIYDPVCAVVIGTHPKQYQTFPNDCFLDLANCKGASELIIGIIYDFNYLQLIYPSQNMCLHTKETVQHD